jgi:signal transduction histidine kinase
MKLTIKNKFALSFAIVFLISTIIFMAYTKRVVEKNNEDIISNEMLDLMLSSREHLKQYLIINDIHITDKLFIQYGQKITDELSYRIKCNTSLYTTEGKYICSSTLENQPIYSLEKGYIKNKYLQDISLAKQDTAAISIYNYNKNTYVKFASPAYINGTYLGIIRFTKNYTDLYNSSNNLIRAMAFFTVLLFILVFTISYLLSKKITSPILKLRKAIGEVAKGNYESIIKINNRDEIGDLAEDFSKMRDKIKEQIETIEDDKKRILKAEKHRKEFFNNITHELKTPLTTISGYAQILEEEQFSSDDMYVKAVERIYSESNRLHNMVIELIEKSKKNSMLTESKFEKINLTEIISKICEDISLKGKKYNISIELKIEQNANIYGSIGEMKELFINILDNAIKYGDINSKIEVIVKKEKSLAHIEVKNKGKGIPENKLIKVFEPFYKMNNGETEKGSSGLGLYICKNIVEKHEGTISIKSISNQYTKIIIEIPLYGNTLATNK